MEKLKHTNSKGKMPKIQLIPHSKHAASPLAKCVVKCCWRNDGSCCKNGTKHTNTLRGHYTEYFGVEYVVCIVTTLLLGATNVSDGHSHLISILQPALPTTQY